MDERVHHICMHIKISNVVLNIVLLHIKISNAALNIVSMRPLYNTEPPTWCHFQKKPASQINFPLTNPDEDNSRAARRSRHPRTSLR
jgi:hypothetical protein